MTNIHSRVACRRMAHSHCQVRRIKSHRSVLRCSDDGGCIVGMHLGEAGGFTSAVGHDVIGVDRPAKVKDRIQISSKAGKRMADSIRLSPRSRCRNDPAQCGCAISVDHHFCRALQMNRLYTRQEGTH